MVIPGGVLSPPECGRCTPTHRWGKCTGVYRHCAACGKKGHTLGSLCCEARHGAKATEDHRRTTRPPSQRGPGRDAGGWECTRATTRLPPRHPSHRETRDTGSRRLHYGTSPEARTRTTMDRPPGDRPLERHGTPRSWESSRAGPEDDKSCCHG